MSDLPIWHVPPDATVAAVLAFTRACDGELCGSPQVGYCTSCGRRPWQPMPSVVSVVGVPNRPTVTTPSELDVCWNCNQDIFWGFAHPDDPCINCDEPIGHRPVRPGERVRVVTDTQPEIGAMFGEWEVRPPAMHPDVHLDGYPRLVSGDVELRIPDPGVSVGVATIQAVLPVYAFNDDIDPFEPCVIVEDDGFTSMADADANASDITDQAVYSDIVPGGWVVVLLSDPVRAAMTLAEIRQERGLSVTELATIVHRNKATVSRWEHHDTRLSSLHRWAGALGGRIAFEFQGVTYPIMSDPQPEEG